MLVEAPTDPTAATVEFAFMRAGEEPEGGDWQEGEWTGGKSDPYEARILLGTGGVSLAEGAWHVWLRIQASPEIPVRDTGVLILT